MILLVFNVILLYYVIIDLASMLFLIMVLFNCYWDCYSFHGKRTKTLLNTIICGKQLIDMYNKNV